MLIPNAVSKQSFKNKVNVEALMKETLAVSCYSHRSAFPKQCIPVAKSF